MTRSSLTNNHLRYSTVARAAVVLYVSRKMKTQYLALLLSFIASLQAIAADIPQALTLKTPATWKVEYKGDKGMQFYTVTRKDGDQALLMFSRSPVSGNVNQIPEQIKQLAKGFLVEAGKHEQIKLKSKEYRIEKIEGDDFSGSFVVFSIEGGFTQAMFMIGDEEGIWNGQFTGTPERWVEAVTILKSLKKKG